MSIIQISKDTNGKVQAQLQRLSVDKQGNPIDCNSSDYNPTPEEKNMRSLVLKHFTLGYVTMYTPRVELNDLSVLMRDQVDQMSWNTYQPNNGNGYEADVVNNWRSNAIRPVVRNKAYSIAAHATARLIFPKVFAFNQQSDDQQDAAQVMSDLMEWAGNESNYAYYSLQRVLQSLYSPASIGYTEYAEVYRNVKTEKDENGHWKWEPQLDEDESGFRDEVVPIDELFIENFYEPDIQKQGWLIRRKVIGYSQAQVKYQHHDNFKYVMPGVQTLYNDANQSWYQVYDTNMRQEDVEEVTYWNKTLDVKIVLVNGIMLTDADNPNPRLDKRYPFDKFGYSIINSRCFYAKSLAFHLQGDASIVNTLYPMIIDGTYLNIMPPMINVGGEVIASDVIVPGAVTTLSSPDSDLRSVKTNNNITAGLNMLTTVENSLNESSQDPTQNGVADSGSQTAFEISKLEQNADTVLGMFIKMISDHVLQYGKLRLSDILQHLTIAEVSDIEDDAPLVYRTFLLPDKQSTGRMNARKIKFDEKLPDEMTEDEFLSESYNTLVEEKNSKQEIYRVNPEKFRKMKYMLAISPDVLNPMSEELERAYMLEEYDRAIMNPLLDQEAVTKDFLLSAYPKSRKDPSKYIKKQNPLQAVDPNAQANLNVPGGQPMQQPGQGVAQPSKSAIASSAPSPVAGQF